MQERLGQGRGPPLLARAEGARRGGRRVRLVRLPASRRNREEVERLSGHRKYPVIEFEDATIYREESKDMAETIRSGQLEPKRASIAAERG